MNARAKKIRPRFFSTNRLGALIDGIFAIAMTLLVLTLDLPEAASVTSQLDLSALLLAQKHKFFNYALSFVLLAVFWVVHHRHFNEIKKTDDRHLWINIAILMFVALIPFSTSLVGDFPGSTLAELFFSANIFVVGSLFALDWIYAVSSRRLVDKKMDRSSAVLETRKIAVVPAVAFIAMTIAFFLPGQSAYVYLAIPFLLALPYFKTKKG